MSIKIGSRPAKQVISKYTDVLTFGKYKGHTVGWLLSNHISYILWLRDNTDIKISDEVLWKADGYWDIEIFFMKIKKWIQESLTFF